MAVDIHDRARRGAAVRGVSIARYLEIIVAQDELADADYVAGQLPLDPPDGLRAQLAG